MGPYIAKYFPGSLKHTYISEPETNRRMFLNSLKAELDRLGKPDQGAKIHAKTIARYVNDAILALDKIDCLKNQSILLLIIVAALLFLSAIAIILLTSGYNDLNKAILAISIAGLILMLTSITLYCIKYLTNSPKVD